MDTCSLFVTRFFQSRAQRFGWPGQDIGSELEKETIMSTAFNSIKRGLLEAIEHTEGRAPYGPALVLLNVITHNSSAVIEALAA